MFHGLFLLMGGFVFGRSFSSSGTPNLLDLAGFNPFVDGANKDLVVFDVLFDFK